MDKKKKVVITRLVTILVCLGLIAFFSWVEQRSGSFRWWHVYVLIGFLIIAILVKVFPLMARVLKTMMKYVGFEKESAGEVSGIRREYFMALVPLSIME